MFQFAPGASLKQSLGGRLGREALRYLSGQDDLPWLYASDFNEILCQSEQLGQNERNENQMDNFNDYLSDCRFADLGYSGHPFT
jgi:hypothetical protein